jgi:hypothetical protein
MVASWRLKMAISPDSILPPPANSHGCFIVGEALAFDFFAVFVGAFP